jgi:hypothetical protein
MGLCLDEWVVSWDCRNTEGFMHQLSLPLGLFAVRSESNLQRVINQPFMSSDDATESR